MPEKTLLDLDWKTVSLDEVKNLVARGADINVRNAYSYTPLHLATTYGRTEIVKFLIDHDTGAYSKNKDGAFHFTERLKTVLRAMLFLPRKGIDMNARNLYGDTLLSEVCQEGHLELVKCFIEHGADVHGKDGNGNTPLHRASANGHIEVVKYLIALGADVHEKDGDGNTPLHRACVNGHIEVVKYLIALGADKNAKNEYNGSAPLHKAIWGNHFEVVKYLVEQGADVKMKDRDGDTPLHKARMYGFLKIVKYLDEMEKPLSRQSFPTYLLNQNKQNSGIHISLRNHVFERE